MTHSLRACGLLPDCYTPRRLRGGSEFSFTNGDGKGKLRGGGMRLCKNGYGKRLRTPSTPPEQSPPTSSSGNAPTPPRKRRGV